MQLDVKNIRKWLLILCLTWFQLCFDKNQLKWADEYFKRQDTVTKQYYLITGLTFDQMYLDPQTISSLTKCFLKQINFFFVILSTNKKEKIKEKRNNFNNADFRNRLLSEKEYMHYIDLLNSYFNKEEYYKISNDIISTFSDQIQNFGDYFPVYYENDSIKIEESILHELTMIQNHTKNCKRSSQLTNKDGVITGQQKIKIQPKRSEIYISCLQKLNLDHTRSAPYFKTFSSKVIKIGDDLIEQFVKVKNNDQESNSKVLMDLLFLLLGYQERIFIAQLEKSYKKQDENSLLEQKNLNNEDVIIDREKMHQMAIDLLNRYNIFKNLGEYVKNIVFKFIDQLYSLENMELFKGEVVYLGQVIQHESKEYLHENTLQMILDVIKIRSKLHHDQKTTESVQAQVNQHTLNIKDRNISSSSFLSNTGSVDTDTQQTKADEDKMQIKNKSDTFNQQIKDEKDQVDTSDNIFLKGVIKNYLNMGKLLNMEEVILLDEYIGNVSEIYAQSENKVDLHEFSKNSYSMSTPMNKKGESLLHQFISKSELSGENERNIQSDNNSFVFINYSESNINNDTINTNNDNIYSQKINNENNSFGQNIQQGNSESSESNEIVRLGSQFLSKQEIERNISKLIQAKKNEGDPDDLLECIISQSKDDSSGFNQSPRKNDFPQKIKLQPILEKGEKTISCSPKNEQRGKPYQSHKEGQQNNQENQQNRLQEQQQRLEYLVIQFNNLMYKIDIICNNENYTELENQTLSCKYTQQIIHCFIQPHSQKKNGQANNQNSSSNNAQTKQKNVQIVRYPPSINTLFFVFYSFLNIKPKLEALEVLKQVGNKQSKIEKYAYVCNAAYLIKSFFQIYCKAYSDEEQLLEIKEQWQQLFDYCLQKNTDPIFGAIAITANKNIFSFYPELLKDQSLINKFFEKSKIVLSNLIDPIQAPEDFSQILQIILANQDFLTACSSSSSHSSLSSLFPQIGIQANNNIQAYFFGPNNTSIWNHASINDQYSKSVRSQVFKSVIILLKNLYSIKDVQKSSLHHLNELINIFINHFSSILTPNITFSTLFSFDVIIHLESLFFTVLLDQHQALETKVQIWEFILKSINSQFNNCKQIHLHSIQFINSFALADQMSLIQKQTINKIMRTITSILQEKVQKDHLITRQLLNCLQNWIFSFRYFEINCRKYFKDTKKFLENLIKALHNISQIEDLQYDVQFFLSQLLKNYLDQKQDDMFNFQLEDVIEMTSDQLASQGRESIYRTVSCVDSMKQQQKIIYEISKIEKEVLKQKNTLAHSPEIQHSQIPTQQNSKKNNQASSQQTNSSQFKKLTKKNSNQISDINEYIPDFLKNRYISFYLDSEKLLSFLIDSKFQIYAIMRDLNGKFIWKIRERSFDSPPMARTTRSLDKFDIFSSIQQNSILGKNENPTKQNSGTKEQKTNKKQEKNQKTATTNNANETQKFEGISLNMVKISSNEDKRKGSKDIVKPTKNDQLQKVIQQVIFFIHESIQQTENSRDFDQTSQNMDDNCQVQSFSPKKFMLSSNNMKQFSLNPQNEQYKQEMIFRSLKSFIQEVPFMIQDTNRCNFIDHTNETYLNIITQIDQYSTSDKVKIGVLYMGKDQTNEYQILSASCGSEKYERFIDKLGEKVLLSEHQGFFGGLSPDRDGEYTVYNHFYNCEIVYHVATMMPAKNKEDKQFVSKKRHIGNDFVNIIWCENIRKYQQCIIPSQLTTAYIVIHPLFGEYYRINILRKDKLGDFFFPWLDKSIVHEHFLDTLVKIVSLQASYCVQQYQIFKKQLFYQQQNQQLEARYHQNLPQNTLRPYKSRQGLIIQLQEQLSIPNKSNQLISDLFLAENPYYSLSGFIGDNSNIKIQNSNTQINSQNKNTSSQQQSNNNGSNNISNRLKL